MSKTLSKQELQAQNQKIFDAIASKYDFMNKITSLGMEPIWKRRAVRCLAPIDTNSAILDLCGGTGDLTNLALCMYGKGQYIVFDMNENMLAAGKHKIPENMRQYITYMQGDAMRLPFTEAAFDKVIICFGLRNVPSMQDCLNEIARVLKPQGLLVCLEFTLPANCFLKLGYKLYMAAFVRLVSILITGKKSTYQYLSSSIAQFAAPYEVRQAIENARLVNKRQIKLFCGVGYIYSAVKL